MEKKASKTKENIKKTASAGPTKRKGKVAKIIERTVTAAQAKSRKKASTPKKTEKSAAKKVARGIPAKKPAKKRAPAAPEKAVPKPVAKKPVAVKRRAPVRRKPTVKPTVPPETQPAEVTTVVMAKYQIAPPGPPVVKPVYPPVEIPELPGEYGDTKIVCLVRDPEWLFVYWEISGERRAELGLIKGQHTRNMAFRVYDVSGIKFDGTNPISFFDVPINDTAVSWYLKIPEPARSYCIDLGVYSDEGDFITVARSNIVTTPRKDASWGREEEWLDLSGVDFHEIYRMSGGYLIRELRGSEEVIRRIYERIKEAVAKREVASEQLVRPPQPPSAKPK
jgi:hypothetical protein